METRDEREQFMSDTTVKSRKAEKVLERLGEKLNRQMVGSMVACVHCGMCTDACHCVLANPGDPTYAPAYKADQIRKLFKRHMDWTGRLFPWWVGAESVHTDEDLEKIAETFEDSDLYKTMLTDYKQGELQDPEYYAEQYAHCYGESSVRGAYPYGEGCERS